MFIFPLPVRLAREEGSQGFKCFIGFQVLFRFLGFKLGFRFL